MSKKIISASIEETTISEVNKIAKQDNNRSFSAMIGILLDEAIAARQIKKEEKK